MMLGTSQQEHEVGHEGIHPADLAPMSISDVVHDNLYIRNVPRRWKARDLTDCFSVAGKVRACRVFMADSRAGALRIGLVQMGSPQEALAAIHRLDGFVPEVDGLALSVQFAKNRCKRKSKSKSINQGVPIFADYGAVQWTTWDGTAQPMLDGSVRGIPAGYEMAAVQPQSHLGIPGVGVPVTQLQAALLAVQPGAYPIALSSAHALPVVPAGATDVQAPPQLPQILFSQLGVVGMPPQQTAVAVSIAGSTPGIPAAGIPAAFVHASPQALFHIPPPPPPPPMRERPPQWRGPPSDGARSRVTDPFDQGPGGSAPRHHAPRGPRAPPRESRGSRGEPGLYSLSAPERKEQWGTHPQEGWGRRGPHTMSSPGPNQQAVVHDMLRSMEGMQIAETDADGAKQPLDLYVQAVPPPDEARANTATKDGRTERVSTPDASHVEDHIS